jgi:hypothetical protein
MSEGWQHRLKGSPIGEDDIQFSRRAGNRGESAHLADDGYPIEAHVRRDGTTGLWYATELDGMEDVMEEVAELSTGKKVTRMAESQVSVDWVDQWFARLDYQGLRWLLATGRI